MMNRKVLGLPLPIVLLLVVVVVLVLGLVWVVSNFQAVFNWVDGALKFIFDSNTRDITIVKCADSPGCSGLYPILYAAIFAFIIITGFAYTTLLERRIIAFIQHRVGPNRVGPAGLLQPAADAVKLIFKEDIFPAGASKWVYLLAPMLKAAPVLMVVAVIPLGPDIIVPWFDGLWYQVPLGLADVNVGVLWFLAITSLATYGVVLAGWSSNNKYAMLGSLRSSAQMISYELTMGLTIAVPVIIVGSMSVGDIINAQKNVWEWFVFQNPLAAGLLMIALLAEVNRAPFDLPEAEQELTQGYMTEYSGMKFAMFMMAEYIGMIAVSMIAIALFFGGYHLIPVDMIPLAAPVNYILKVVLFLVGMVWVRGTLPRIRYDRLMTFGWKVMLPLAIVSVLWTAVATVIGEEVGAASSVPYALASGALFVLVLAFGYLMLRRAGEEDAVTEPDIADDPRITGERQGIGWALVMLLGGLIAIPFALIGWTIRLFEGIQRAGQAPSEETALAVVEDKSSAPAKSGGD